MYLGGIEETLPCIFGLVQSPSPSERSKGTDYGVFLLSEEDFYALTIYLYEVKKVE